MNMRTQLTSSMSSIVMPSNFVSNPVIMPQNRCSEVQVSRPAVQDPSQKNPTRMERPYNLSLDTSKLPSLPVLPAHLRNLPYIRCRQWPAADKPSSKHLGKHIFHQRQELVGDAVLEVLVREWLINGHPFLHAEVAAVRPSSKAYRESRPALIGSRPSNLQAFWAVLLSNSLFARLARAYGMADKLAATSPDEAAELTEEDKVLANAFEAYFGLLMREVASGHIKWNILKDYVHDLFSSGAFPDLEARLRTANQNLSVKREPVQLPSKSPGLHMDKEAKELVEQSDRQQQPTAQHEPESPSSKEPSRKRAKRDEKEKQANPRHEYVATASDKPPGK